ncbi:hypothetical protein SM124_04155 (plasmid) [Bacillus sp. 31A1R]|uniref:Uncharacterized protein n=1 Tax=Robertmurraya mangrovi TaxID=3098077 RepID=A0ABU5IV11_9BACI|nr:hypothetical protein [Bacillus sp. 31A1R]MDZ5470941.1 hypothetical protein [Bacillus sp. 31A1R]
MEFLFENPFILVVLIGIISSLFKRMKGEQPEEQQKRPTPKPVVQKRKRIEEQNPTLAQEIEMQRQKEQQRQQEHHQGRNKFERIEKQYQEKKKQAEEKIAAMKKQQLVSEKKSQRMSSTSRMNSATKDHVVTPQEDTSFYQVDEKKLADAVVWAEILGPPRAKNPHRARR